MPERNRNAVPLLRPCARPFCGGRARVRDDEGHHWIECEACGASHHAPRDPNPAQRRALVEQWNAPTLPPAQVLPAFLRDLAARQFGAERAQLLDAAELIERQAAALVERVA
ncbi:Lar family restriction alleviation protein [Pseudomonas aeruginosa]